MKALPSEHSSPISHGHQDARGWSTFRQIPSISVEAVSERRSTFLQVFLGEAQEAFCTCFWLSFQRDKYSTLRSKTCLSTASMVVHSSASYGLFFHSHLRDFRGFLLLAESICEIRLFFLQKDDAQLVFGIFLNDCLTKERTQSPFRPRSVTWRKAQQRNCAYCKEGSRKPEKERLEVLRRLFCVERREREAWELFLGVKARLKPPNWRLCAMRGAG